MIELFLKFLGIKTCSHPNVETNKVLSYCPDCGKLIRINWYIVKCHCCGKKRIGIIRGNKVIPLSRFCTNCGDEEYNVEKINNINFFNMNYAVARKEEENTVPSHECTQTWVDENDILDSLRCLPQYLN